MLSYFHVLFSQQSVTIRSLLLLCHHPKMLVNFVSERRTPSPMQGAWPSSTSSLCLSLLSVTCWQWWPMTAMLPFVDLCFTTSSCLMESCTTPGGCSLYHGAHWLNHRNWPYVKTILLWAPHQLLLLWCCPTRMALLLQHLSYWNNNFLLAGFNIIVTSLTIFVSYLLFSPASSVSTPQGRSKTPSVHAAPHLAAVGLFPMDLPHSCT